MRLARFWARVRVGIIASRLAQRVSVAGSTAGKGPVGAHRLGNSNALRGVVT
ncbi:hypothetical protein [Mycobacterium sp.]|uniref:hypothetical protein n=1 Tax=Mycobacterium sp. TaxID=1785 RepID=UPI003F9591E0